MCDESSTHVSFSALLHYPDLYFELCRCMLNVMLQFVDLQSVRMSLLTKRRSAHVGYHKRRWGWCRAQLVFDLLQFSCGLVLEVKVL